VIERLTTQITQNNIAVSRRTQEDMQKYYRSKVELITNGIDFHHIQDVKSNCIDNDVIFVGRLIKEKNVDLLIKAIQLVRLQIPDITCIIVGDGPEKPRLQQLVKDLDVDRNIKFIHFLEKYDDVISYMKTSKIFVLPSKREGFGIVVVEANACGLPVITINAKGNAAMSLISNEINGFIVEESEEVIAVKIIQALNMDMREKSLEKSKIYDWDVITDRYEQYLQTVV
jgi:glycosyltransferase involved in cell wall biosynthesis